MSLYRHNLPQLDRRLFLADGGIETTLIFHDGLDLPDFAAFHLLRDEPGQAALRRYFRGYAEIARRHKLGLILETATWRASQDWGQRLGYDRSAMAAANRASVGLIEELRAETQLPNLVISGCLGPRGDGYTPSAIMNIRQAAEYHRPQVDTFAETAADLVTAITMNYVEEAIGIAQAARAAGMPCVIAFTVETDGTLPSGQALADAIDETDQATSGYPAYYMINCAHPEHFEPSLRGGASRWLNQIRGVRANASRMSHAELNEAPALDSGDPEELAAQYASLTRTLPQLNVMGGCCGTDERHVASIAQRCAPLFSS